MKEWLRRVDWLMVVIAGAVYCGMALAWLLISRSERDYAGEYQEQIDYLRQYDAQDSIVVVTAYQGLFYYLRDNNLSLVVEDSLGNRRPLKVRW